jgi:hypothetical protein
MSSNLSTSPTNHVIDCSPTADTENQKEINRVFLEELRENTTPFESAHMSRKQMDFQKKKTSYHMLSVVQTNPRWLPFDKSFFPTLSLSLCCYLLIST